MHEQEQKGDQFAEINSYFSLSGNGDFDLDKVAFNLQIV